MGKRRLGLLFFVSALAIAGLTVANARATSSSPSGNFSSVQVTGPSCASPVGLCTQGELTGGLKGTFTFTATSLMQSVDTPTTGVLLYTGDLSLTTKDGGLMCKDAGAFKTAGDGAVSSVCVIVSGSGSLDRASGEIQFVGFFTSAGGMGDYRATISVP